jgi:hypothetical protein
MDEMRNGKGKWVSASGEEVKSAEYPDVEPQDGFRWFPAYNPRRVQGDSYTPYEGSDDWTRAANRAMSLEARDNWNNR